MTAASPSGRTDVVSVSVDGDPSMVFPRVVEKS
jgi:hypothetical protein